MLVRSHPASSLPSVAAILLVVLAVLFLSPSTASAHGTGTYTLCVNCSYDRVISGCTVRETHGNYNSQAYAQQKIISGSSCQYVEESVTACYGLNCPTWSGTGGSTVGVTYQATSSVGYSLVYSHHVSTISGVTRTYHANY